ncbi:MAG TPA: cation-transporting P-type ATPase, partial [Steroidobacteraceae bacterium]
MPWHRRPVAEVLSMLEATRDGLSTAEARRRLESHGPNAIAEAKPRSWTALLAAQFLDVPILV